MVPQVLDLEALLLDSLQKVIQESLEQTID
jgi:hypothetical protein